MVNKAIGGTNAGTFGTCLERLVPQVGWATGTGGPGGSSVSRVPPPLHLHTRLPFTFTSTLLLHLRTAQDADLITVELTYNEHPSLPYSSPDRKGFEALLRKLLRLPGSPAVLLLHHFSWYHRWGALLLTNPKPGCS